VSEACSTPLGHGAEFVYPRADGEPEPQSLYLQAGPNLRTLRAPSRHRFHAPQPSERLTRGWLTPTSSARWIVTTGAAKRLPAAVRGVPPRPGLHQACDRVAQGARWRFVSRRLPSSERPNRGHASSARTRWTGVLARGAPMRLTRPGRSVQAPARRRTHYTPRHGATGSASARICGSWRYGIERHSNAQSFERSVTRISQSGMIEGVARPLPS
jgi:hypothetical protein